MTSFIPAIFRRVIGKAKPGSWNQFRQPPVRQPSIWQTHFRQSPKPPPDGFWHLPKTKAKTMIQIESEHLALDGAPTTPATRRTAAKTPTAPAAPTDLQSRVQGITADAARLKNDLTAQQARLADLDVIKGKQDAVHVQLEAEEIDYPAASARLAELADHAAALGWTTTRKGEALLAFVHEFRQNCVNLKDHLLLCINRAAGAAVEARQREVAALVASWDSVPAPESPLPILTVAAACKTCRILDGHRMALEAWRPDDGPAAFAAVAGAAADFLATVPVPEDAGLKWGGISRREISSIYGWDGASDGPELVASFATPAEANAAYSDLRARSGFAGLRQLFRMETAGPDNESSLPSPAIRETDQRQISALAEVFPAGSGINTGFLANVIGWLNLDSAANP